MMFIMNDKKHPIKIWGRDNIDEKAIQQVNNVASMPFIFKHVAVMPDAHWGMGATIGSVIATTGAVIPAAVGIDLGCGMKATKTSLMAADLPENLKELRHAIESAVPHGRTHQGGPGDRGAWHNIPNMIGNFAKVNQTYIEYLLKKHPEIGKRWNLERIFRHAGTLGTGNHFIEICLDESQCVWVMLHSGSRGIGNAIGNYFINLAKKEMKNWFINLPDQDLAYISEGSKHFNDYLEAVHWAQQFAHLNRDIMLVNTMAAIEKSIYKKVKIKEIAVDCHHNYISKEKHFNHEVYITRKGAVSAKEGELGIIPGSMGAKSFIVKGLGNPESFHSCSHGAGRIMSRSQARKIISLEDHDKATAGVECRKDESVIDESPAAYKDIDEVMNAQSDLVEIIHTLKQILCVKG